MKKYIEDVEKMMNTREKPTKGFKFKIGQKVHHKLFHINGRIARRMYMEEIGAELRLYDVGVADGDTRVLAEIDEEWLGEGHLRKPA